jgi:UDP-2,4-diacetamido-2,4,6-trideoxy-beta-L-altropyranose hydrolase
MKVLLHADGGVGVGLGHISRCVTISKALARAGHQTLVVVDPKRKLLNYVVRHGVNGENCGASAKDIHGTALAFNADFVVIDSYRWSAEDFVSVRGEWAVVAFDDEAVRELLVDAVINGAPAAGELRYLTGTKTRLWLGNDYQIVRDDFRLMPPRKYTGPVKRVIALVGGDDPLGLLPVLAQLLDDAAVSRSFVADVICGPFTPMPEVQGLRHVTILRNPSSLCERMATADLAISASGQTVYELARCGTPTIAYCSGFDQTHNLTALAKANVVWNAGDATNPNWARNVSSAINNLIVDDAARAAMSRTGQAMIDGLGADRLVSAFESLLSEPSSTLN